jgi:hypothetical protein
MVGSGKSTAAGWTQDVLIAHGQRVSSLNFQTLRCFALLRSSHRAVRRPGESDPEEDRPESVRWRNYKRRRLTLVAAAAYVARILAFRLYRRSWPRNQAYVINRYFYDSFVHYRLETRTERMYFAAVRALMPVPDIPVVLLAAPETIAARRPRYSREYLAEVHGAYQRLREWFPELIELRTDSSEPSAERLERVVVEHLRGRAAPGAAPTR